MRLRAVSSIALSSAFAAGMSVAQPAGIHPVEPFSQGVLALTLGRCFDEGMAAGGRAKIEACEASVRSMFSGVDALRSDPRMRDYIWHTCINVSGYPAFASEATLRVFAVCTWRMMERCEQGLGDGYELTLGQCVRAIQSMGWLQAPETKPPARKRP